MDVGGPLQNEQAEALFLGCMIVNPELVPEYAQHVSKPWFYRESHRVVWGAIDYLIRHSKTIDEMSVLDALNARKDARGQTYLEAVGGARYVATLTTGVVSADNQAKSSFDRLQEYYQRRQLARVASTMKAMVDEGQPAERVLAEVSAGLSEIAQERTDEDAEAEASSVVRQITKRLEQRMQGKTDHLLATGIEPVDVLMDGGFLPGVNTILGALSGHGKTTITSAIVAGLLENNPDLVVDWYSCEVPAELQMQRIASSHADLPERYWRAPNEAKEDFHRRAMKGMGWLNELGERLRVYRMGRLDIRKVALKAAARRSSHSGDYVVVVDYLQRATYGKHDSKSDRVAAASEAMAGIALDHNAVCLSLTQFTTEAKDEPIPIPNIGTARWAKDIEHDAADFLVYHRPQKSMRGLDRRCILQLAKSRYGRLGHVEMCGSPSNRFRWWNDYDGGADVPGLHTPRFTEREER